MIILSVFVAALAAFALGAAWYGVLAEPWMTAAGVKRGPDGKPEGSASPLLYLASFLLILVVAGMMRHILTMTGISSLGAGALAGLGVGLFLITPWIGINNLYGGRPAKLTLIDGGYATFGCALMTAILTLF